MDGTNNVLVADGARDHFLSISDDESPHLRAKQAEALEPLRDRWILGDPPGAGKTAVGLTWLRKKGAGLTLIVCPSNVVHHWARLAASWYPEARTVVVPKGTAIDKRAALRISVYVPSGDSRPVIYITSYALLREDIGSLIEFKWDAVIFDEAHRLRGRSTLIHQAAEKLAHRTKLLLLATGSPILNRAEECWSLMHLLDPRRWKSYWRWVDTYFHISNTTFGGRVSRPVQVVGDPKEGAIQEIAVEFGKFYVARSEEVMLPGLAPPQHVWYEVDLGTKERKIYNSLVKHGWAVDDASQIITPNEVSKITRLRQLTSDWITALGDEHEPGAKVLACAELIEDLGLPVLVFVSFKATAEALAKSLLAKRIPVWSFTGDGSEQEREASLENWKRKGGVLVGTYGALAEGTDGLQQYSHHVILLDHDWVPEIERQAVGRLRRDGQDLQVVVHHIVALNTIDDHIEALHERKQEAAAGITKGKAA